MNVAQCNEAMTYVIRAINAIDEGKRTIKDVVTSYRVNIAAMLSNDVVTRCDIEIAEMYKRKAMVKADLLNVKRTIEGEKEAALADAMEAKRNDVVGAAIERVKSLVSVEQVKQAKAFYVRVDKGVVSFSLTRYNEQTECDVELTSDTVGVYAPQLVGAVYRAVIEFFSSLKPVIEKSRVYTNKGNSIFTYEQYVLTNEDETIMTTTNEAVTMFEFAKAMKEALSLESPIERAKAYIQCVQQAVTTDELNKSFFAASAALHEHFNANSDDYELVEKMMGELIEAIPSK